MTRDEIVRSFARLAELVRQHGAQGEVCLLGGTVMVLAFSARESTKDVDAIFAPAPLIRTLAERVATEMDLPEDWLNDSAKGFVSARHDTTADDLPQFENLRITAPTAEYMLAMKCMAARIGASVDDPGDVADIRFLIGHLGLTTVDEALEIVTQYYPAGRVPQRTIYLLEGLMAEPEELA